MYNKLLINFIYIIINIIIFSNTLIYTYNNITYYENYSSHTYILILMIKIRFYIKQIF